MWGRVGTAKTMSFLAQSTELGELEIVDVYEFYDRPLLFSCINALGIHYLVVLADVDDETETWLYASVSPARLQDVRSGGVDLHDAFGLTEDQTIFVVRQGRTDSCLKEINRVACESLIEDWLPSPGAILRLVQVGTA